MEEVLEPINIKEKYCNFIIKIVIKYLKIINISAMKNKKN